MRTVNRQQTLIKGILYIGEVFVRVPNDISPIGIGKIILRRAMYEENYRFNITGRTQWLQSWADELNEREECESNSVSSVIEYAVDMLLYSNAPHVIGINNSQVPSEYMREVERELIDLLTTENN